MDKHEWENLVGNENIVRKDDCTWQGMPEIARKPPVAGRKYWTDFPQGESSLLMP